jgi:hypothetical protein
MKEAMPGESSLLYFTEISRLKVVNILEITDAEDKEGIQRDAFERVNALLSELGAVKIQSPTSISPQSSGELLYL